MRDSEITQVIYNAFMNKILIKFVYITSPNNFSGDCDKKTELMHILDIWVLFLKPYEYSYKLIKQTNQQYLHQVCCLGYLLGVLRERMRGCI